MRDIQGRGERSPGAARGAEVGGRGSTKERDEPLSPPSPPEGAPNRTGLRGRPGGVGVGVGGVVKRKCLLPSREEPGMAGHPEGSRMWKHRRDTRERSEPGLLETGGGDRGWVWAFPTPP